MYFNITFVIFYHKKPSKTEVVIVFALQLFCSFAKNASHSYWVKRFRRCLNLKWKEGVGIKEEV